MTEQQNQALNQNDVWVTHNSQCLTFHDYPGFVKLEFPDTETMLEEIFKFLYRGYTVK